MTNAPPERASLAAPSPPLLRAAVIGCGYFAQNHLHAWRMIPEVSVAAVCDVDPARARETAERHGVARWYTRVEDLLRAERIDFADIVTQAHTHLPIVEQVAPHVRGVICQKPFAPSVAQARRMVELCERRGVRLMVHENFRFQRALRAAQVFSRELGRLFFGRIHFRSGHDVYADQPYLATEDRFIVYDVGVHLFDLARFYFGEAESVYCHTQRVNSAIRAEDVATALLVMRGGATCVVDMSYASKLAEEHFPQTQLHLEGERGSVTVEGDYRVTFVKDGVRGETLAPPLHPWSRPPGEVVQDSVLTLQRHYVDAWLAGGAVEVSGQDNLQTLRLTFAAYDSAARSVAVTLDERDETPGASP